MTGQQRKRDQMRVVVNRRESAKERKKEPKKREREREREQGLFCVLCSFSRAPLLSKSMALRWRPETNDQSSLRGQLTRSSKVSMLTCFITWPFTLVMTSVRREYFSNFHSDKTRMEWKVSFQKLFLATRQLTFTFFFLLQKQLAIDTAVVLSTK